MHEEKQHLRDRLVARRRELGLRQREVAQRFGLAGQTICLWENGPEYYPKIAVVEALERMTIEDFPEAKERQSRPPRLRYSRKVPGPEDFAALAASQARAEDIRHRLANQETLESISKTYGITRERVRQIAAKIGAVNIRMATVPARREARLAAKAVRATEKATRLQERAVRLSEARRLVEQEGWSIRKAMFVGGFVLHELQLARGWQTTRGRWCADLPERRVKAIELYKSGMPTKDISAIVRLTPATIIRLATEAGLKISRRYSPRVQDPDRDKRICAAYESGMTVTAVAAQEHVAQKTAGLVLSRAGISIDPARRSSQRAPVMKRQSIRAPISRVLLSFSEDDCTSDWPTSKMQILCDGWNANKSAAQIARDLGEGYTRNSVLGRIFRKRRAASRKSDSGRAQEGRA